MSMLAVITARGGSKRIPRKNIRDFLGRPMISYAISAARESGLFTEVMVSTEDEEIARVSRECGALVPFMRSQKNADDFACTADVLREVISCYEQRGRTFDDLCCIYPCVPLLRPSDLAAAYARYQELGVEALTPVVRFSYPVQRALVVDREGLLHYREPEFAPMRSQDLEPVFHDVGMFYFQRWDLYRLEQVRTAHYEMGEESVQDIDNESDWKMAEIKYRVINHV